MAEGGEADDEWAWRGGPLAALEAVETRLRCPICARLLRGACSLGPCGHSFCSECVRRAISEKAECPSCRAPCSGGDVRVNRALDAVRIAWEAARPAALAVARGEAVVPAVEALGPREDAERRQQQQGNRKRMANVVYHLLKEKDLRRKLKSLRLPITGSKEAMAFRHKEYALRFNSYLDRHGAVPDSALPKLRKQALAQEELMKSNRQAPSLFTGELPSASAPPTEGPAPTLTKEMLELESSREVRQRFRRLLLQVLERQSEASQHTKVRERARHLLAQRKRRRRRSKRKRERGREQESDSVERGAKKVRVATGQDDVETLCQGEDWRKAWSDDLRVYIYYNERTHEAYVAQAPANETSSPAEQGRQPRGEGAADATNAPGPAAEWAPDQSPPEQPSLPQAKPTKQPAPPERKVIDLEDDETESSSAQAVAWACPRCTYHNSAEVGSCEMCDLSRPGRDRAQGPSAAGGADAATVKSRQSKLPIRRFFGRGKLT